MTQFTKGYIPWNKGKTGLQTAWNKGKKGYQSGKKHYNWKGGIKHSTNGYILISKPEHPFADKQDYVAKHRLVAERRLGRYLTELEIIHHINEITDDNRIKNLYLFENRWKHGAYHRAVNCGKRKPITISNLL